MPDDKTEEMLLLTCSEYLTGYNLEQLANLLGMMVVKIDSDFYFITDVRIDETEGKIYGRGHKLQEYGEFK